MVETNRTVSRRRLLELTGGSVVAASGTSLASDDATRVEVNVGFGGAAGRTAAVEAAVEVTREFSFDAMTLDVPERAVAGLENHPDVRYVEENGDLYAFDTVPWGVERIDAHVTQARGETGAGADVAIIDTGIYPHPDLAPNLGNGNCFVDCGGSPSWTDVYGHGTHVAGTVAAAQNGSGIVGVAPEATLHAVKVLDDAGSGSYADIAAGIEWSANQEYDVANLSLGGPYSQIVADACEYAYCMGVLLVGAAGNGGPCTNCVTFPGSLDEVLAVGAIDRHDNLAAFSSTGPEIELLAPGDEIRSTAAGGGFTRFTGTSMAAPHVSGVGALVMAQGDSNLRARTRLTLTAEDLGLSPDEQGFGLVDAANAAL